MTYQPITIFYEDSVRPKSHPRDFGFHRFVMTCIFDRIDQDRPDLENACTCNPRNGSSEILKSIRNDIEYISRDGRNVVAVFDHDKVTKLLKIDKETRDDVIIEKIKGECPLPDKLHVFLIRENLESVIENIERCDQSNLIDRKTIRLAKEKHLDERDLVFKKASSLGGSKAIRDCVLEKMDVLKRMVREVIKLLQEQNAQ